MDRFISHFARLGVAVLEKNNLEISNNVMELYLHTRINPGFVPLLTREMCVTGRSRRGRIIHDLG
jgi:hypothetical protein